MEKKEEKRSFWASLFTPKTCSCSCGNNIIEELEDEKEQLPKVPAKNENENRSEEENHCSCCEKNNQT